MPKYVYESLVVAEAGTEPSSDEDQLEKRPSWAWILREKIEPLCIAYGLVIEYESTSDESCALFYDDVWFGE